MAFTNDKFCHFFFTFFQQIKSIELQDIAMIGLGNVMIDFPQVKFHFYKMNLLPVFSNRIREDAPTKRLLQQLWFLQILTQDPYSPELTPAFFSDTDFLLEKYRGKPQVYKILTKIIFQLTIEGHLHSERIKQCISMKNFQLMLGVTNGSDTQTMLQCIEILFNLTHINDTNIMINLL